jgi:hypothetical protein
MKPREIVHQIEINPALPFPQRRPVSRDTQSLAFRSAQDTFSRHADSRHPQSGLATHPCGTAIRPAFGRSTPRSTRTWRARVTSAARSCTMSLPRSTSNALARLSSA